MLARMVARQCALALCLSSAADAASVHNWDAFKTVDAIGYVADIAVDLDKPINCKLDKDALGTNLRFVANQSLRLKIIPPQERFERQQALEAEVTTLSDKLVAMGYEKPNTAEYLEIQKQLNSAGTRALHYNWMPLFTLPALSMRLAGRVPPISRGNCRR